LDIHFTVGTCAKELRRLPIKKFRHAHHVLRRLISLHNEHSVFTWFLTPQAVGQRFRTEGACSLKGYTGYILNIIRHKLKEPEKA
jgi:hypothetical protein